ncbi:FAD-binding oxidoreductase [Alicyclobacillus sp. ALC3]|uniref:FAD-binding oxidoreductase n=1 Tax=Alicyclobacillus sp. ALC3 TaxID=2796143 RepID=UPI0023783759|nr:FAD-binding oxidoreductase [Alicyclobacillus sp. ALC3]WDL96133.1 FAD-binding oxidoreductase [Alicyclobacillus sp. ALC3]
MEQQLSGGVKHTETLGRETAQTILASLSEICSADAVHALANGGELLQTGGDYPAVLVEPVDEAQAAAVMKRASEAGWKVKPLGAGTQLTGEALGERVHIVLSMGRMKQVLDFSPSDLVVTVQPGVTLSELEGVLAAEQKMLPLDPWLPSASTIGGIASTAASGPRRALYGGVRDMAIALRVVYPDGTVIRTGSKVVKNVAGYDMTKLFVGSRGTLGLITELTFKLRPLPLHRETVVLVGSAEDIRLMRSKLVASVLVPARVQALSSFEEPSGVWTLAVDCDENERSAQYQTEQLKAWATEHSMSVDVLRGSAANDWWGLVREQTLGADLVVRLAATPTNWSDLAAKAAEVATRYGVDVRQSWALTLGTGEVFVRRLDPELAIQVVTELRDAATRVNGTAVIQHAAAQVRQRVDPFGPVGRAGVLFERVKHQIDPGRIMSPATFAGGI